MGWNYRCVAEWIPHEKPILSGWHFTIRDVYYENDKPRGYGADPQAPQADCYNELKADHELMKFAFDKPLLVLHKGELMDAVEYMKKTNRAIPITIDDSLELHGNLAEQSGYQKGVPPKKQN